MMAQRTSQRKSTGKLLRAAIRFLRKSDTQRVKRGRDINRMEPHALRHTLEGNAVRTPYNSRRLGPGQYNRRTGYHYRPGGEDMPGRRTQLPPVRRHRSGAYEAHTEFEVPNDAPPPPTVWRPKAGNQGKSTFFPDDWTPGKIDSAVSDAFRNGTKNADGSWEGTGPDGLKITGYYDVATGSIKHGYPSI
jgi:hypothetical protein